MTGPAPAGSPRIEACLVAHSAYGALSGGTQGHVGGVERQTSLMARWLAARGHAPSLVTWDEGQPDGTLLDGVRVLTLCRRDAGIRFVRFLHPRWTSLNAALARADARLYYHNCSEAVTGQVALFARRRGRPFVYSLASDEDCDPQLRHLTLRERVLYRYGLRRADRVIAQTESQRRRLREHFGVAAAVLPMPCPGPADVELPARPVGPPPARALWLGRVCDVKRPHLLLELARACPQLGFDLVGPSDGTRYAAQVLEQAAGIPNLVVHGPASRRQVADHYRGAGVLLCTSHTEGFPNTFLEAWSYGVPVVTSFDPDGLVSAHGLGAAAPDVPGLAAALRALLESPQAWHAAAGRARRHYLAHHEVDTAMRRFEAVFFELDRGPR